MKKFSNGRESFLRFHHAHRYIEARHTPHYLVDALFESFDHRRILTVPAARGSGVTTLLQHFSLWLRSGGAQVYVVSNDTWWRDHFRVFRTAPSFRGHRPDYVILDDPLRDDSAVGVARFNAWLKAQPFSGIYPDQRLTSTFLPKLPPGFPPFNDAASFEIAADWWADHGESDEEKLCRQWAAMPAVNSADFIQWRYITQTRGRSPITYAADAMRQQREIRDPH